MIKNKFLIIFFISISFILLFTFDQKVGAVFQVESNNDDTTFYNLPNLPEKPSGHKASLILQRNIDGVDYFYLYYLISSSQDTCFIARSFSDYFQVLSYCSTGSHSYYIYRVENDTWILKANSSVRSQNIHFGSTDSSSTDYFKDFLYTDKDICVTTSKYNGIDYISVPDTTKDPFFRCPSIWKVNLFKARELAEILPMANKIITMILPAGLGIFSTLLVISLIKSKKWRTI